MLDDAKTAAAETATKAPDPTPEPAKPEKKAPRAVLKPDEVVEGLEVVVASAEGAMLKVDGVTEPSTAVKFTGDFHGLAYHFKSGIPDGVDTDGTPRAKPGAIYQPGQKLIVTLFGRHFPRANKTHPFVQDVKAVGGATELE